jgi:hypothetical protein
MKIQLLTHLLIPLLIGCSPTLKVKQLNPETGKYPTDTPLKADEIKKRSSLNLSEYKQFLYVKQGVNFEKYENYIIGTLKNIGYFNEILSQNELEQLVIQKELTDRVTNISDNIGLANLQKEIGQFLVVNSNVEYKGAYTYIFDFELVDPSKAETVYHVRHQAFNFSGLDRPLFNPVFNDYIDWINENK